MNYPLALDASKVGTYAALARAGGGYVWDAVLEYRVWCHPQPGADDEANGSDTFHAFSNYEDAARFSRDTAGADEPIALVLQREHIDETSPGDYTHVREERITEWPVELLQRPQRTERTIPDFLAPDAPENRLDIIRGLD